MNLLGKAEANSCFTLGDVGAFGRENDSNWKAFSDLKRSLNEKYSRYKHKRVIVLRRGWSFPSDEW